MTVSPGAVVGAESDRYLLRKLNEAAPRAARDAVREMVESTLFEDAFAAGELLRWPLAVVPTSILRPIRDAGVETAAQTVTFGMRKGEIERSHPEVDVEQLRLLQQTLDRGEVIWEKPGRDGRHIILAHHRDDKGGWWRYEIEIKKADLPLITVFHEDKR